MKEIEQAACFRVRQRRLRCPREGLFAEAAEWLGSEDVCPFSGASDLRRETDPRGASLEHEHEVALALSRA